MAKKLTVHPVAALFPLMADADPDAFAGMVADIKENGQTDPIIVKGSEIVDGRNRLAACAEAGVDPAFAQWSAPKGVTVEKWIVSRNLHRRHMSTSARAMLIPDLVKAGAFPNLESGAEAMGVSTQTAYHAETIHEKGSAALKAAVLAEDVKVSAGAEVAGALPKSEQTALVKKGGDAVPAKARKIREKKASAPKGDKTAQMRALREAQREEAVIPQPIRAAWKFLSDAAPEMKSEMTSIRRRVKAAVEKLIAMSSERPVAPGTVLLSLKNLDKHLDAAEYDLARLIPSVVCEKCAGEGCGKCGKVGWLSAVDVKRIGVADAKGNAALAKAKR